MYPESSHIVGCLIYWENIDKDYTAGKKENQSRFTNWGKNKQVLLQQDNS